MPKSIVTVQGAYYREGPGKPFRNLTETLISQSYRSGNISGKRRNRCPDYRRLHPEISATRPHFIPIFRNSATKATARSSVLRKMKMKQLGERLGILRKACNTGMVNENDSLGRREILFPERSALTGVSGYSFLNPPACSETPGRGLFLQSMQARTLFCALWFVCMLARMTL